MGEGDRFVACPAGRSGCILPPLKGRFRRGFHYNVSVPDRGHLPDKEFYRRELLC